MKDRTCTACGTDISGLHGNAKRCLGCREKNPFPAKGRCSNGCDAPVFVAGECRDCYRTTRREEGRVTREENRARFWACVDRRGPVPEKHPELGPCWLWTGRTTAEGLGTLQADHRWAYAHRFAYELLIGPIPGKRRVFQRCEVTRCVNPAHLMALSELDEKKFKKQREAAKVPVVTAPADDPELAYWGALLDGEAHLGIHKAWWISDPDHDRTTYSAVLSLRMTDRDLVQEFASAFGLAVSPRTYSNPLSVLPIYETACAGKPAAEIVRKLLPYFRLKGRQAELMLRLEEEKDWPGLRSQEGPARPRHMSDGRVIMRRPTGYAQEHLDRWHEYHLAVRRLNKPSREIV